MEIDLFKLETIAALTIYSFLLIIFIVVLRYFIFSKDIENKGVSKIVGGLAVFIVALLSQNSAVIFVSLFIGGLIIASEDFMQKLAIIFRSESKDISENLKPVSATPKEIKQKQQQEIQETVEVSEIEMKSIKKVDSKYLLKATLHGEKAVAKYLQETFENRFVEDIKFENNQGKKILVDGVIYNDDFEPSQLIEIRVLKQFKIANSLLARTVDKVRNVIPDLPLLLCFVFVDNVSKTEVKLIEEFANNFFQVRVMIFSLKDDTLKLLTTLPK